jgi:hypothetical protein
MALSSEHEKEFDSAGDTKTSTSTEGSPHLYLSPLRETTTNRSHKSFQSHRGSRRSCSRSSGPYENPQRHLTQEAEVEDSQHSVHEVITHIRTATSIGSHASRPPDFEVVFEDDDPENPRNWPLWYRAYVLVCVSYSCWVVVLYSTSYTAAIPGVIEEYNTTSSIATLGVTTYLFGLATGTLVVAPLSELYGRRIIYLVCMLVSTLLIIPCAMATSLTEILVVRYIG